MIHLIYTAFLFLSAVLTLFIVKKKPESGWPGLHRLATRLKWMCAVQLIPGIFIAWNIEQVPGSIVRLYLIFSLLPALIHGKKIKMIGVFLCMTLFSHGLYSLALYPPL